MKTLCIIPVYNEFYKIHSLLKKLKPFSISANNEIIIVDDGSNDGTEIILQETSFGFLDSGVPE